MTRRKQARARIHAEILFPGVLVSAGAQRAAKAAIRRYLERGRVASYQLRAIFTCSRCGNEGTESAPEPECGCWKRYARVRLLSRRVVIHLEIEDRDRTRPVTRR